MPVQVPSCKFEAASTNSVVIDIKGKYKYGYQIENIGHCNLIFAMLLYWI